MAPDLLATSVLRPLVATGVHLLGRAPAARRRLLGWRAHQLLEHAVAPAALVGVVLAPLGV